MSHWMSRFVERFCFTLVFWLGVYAALMVASNDWYAWLLSGITY